jgi:hypothetical protein
MKEYFTGVLVLLLVLVIVCLFSILNDRQKNTEAFHNRHHHHNRHHNCNNFKKLNRYNISSSPPWVLNPELNPDIYKITNAIIKSINSKLKLNYQLDKFDNVIEDYDIEGNKRYVMDFFVHQINHQHVNDVNRRIILDVSLLKNYNNINVRVNTLNFSNAIKYKDPEYSNDTTDSLILKKSITGKDEELRGNPLGSSLENNPFNSPKKIDTNDINRRPWILPLEIQDKSTSHLIAFPCQQYGNWWDENAIPLTKQEENKLNNNQNNNDKQKKPEWCYNSYNSATEPSYIVAQRYPQFLKQPSDRHTNDWMFDRRQGLNESF